MPIPSGGDGWAPSYTSADELKAYVRVSDNLDDVQVSLACEAASRAVDRACGRQFGKLTSAAARYFTPRWDPAQLRWIVPIDDLMDSAGLAVTADPARDGTFTTTITSYDLKPLNSQSEGRPWTQVVVRSSSSAVPVDGEDSVKITALWGWSAVPDTIKQATLLQASRLLARRDSPFGIAGSAEMGSELRLLAKVDPDVELLTRPYARIWGAAATTHPPQLHTLRGAWPWVWGGYP